MEKILNPGDKNGILVFKEGATEIKNALRCGKE